MLQTFKIIFIGFLFLYLMGGLLLYFAQDKMIFLPEPLPSDYGYEFESPFDEHTLAMEDGATINALHFKVDSSKGLILYCHGNAGNLARWGEVVLPFQQLGYEVLIFDYRGYGKSTGKRTRKSLLSDADEMYAFARTLQEESKIVLFGRSLGSAFASYLGGKNNPSMIILETPFFNLKDVAEAIAPIYPIGALLHYRFRNDRWLEDASSHIFIFHGTEDEVVPYSSGQKLYNSLPEGIAELITIEGGHHNDLSQYDDYWYAMKTLLADE